MYGTKKFLKEKGIQLSNQGTTELYFILGGVPYYLNQLNKDESIAQNINKICFQSDGILFDEFNKIFLSLFEEYRAYEELIRLIFKNRHGISRAHIEKTAKLTAKGGTLSERLEDLEMAGFVKKFLPLSHTKKGIYYRILDEYTYFYLQWIESEKGNIELDLAQNNFWLDIVKSAKYQAWCGYAFESVCYKHVSNVKKALGINVASKIGTWRYIPKLDEETQGAQIDLLFDRNDNAITICEIKYSNKPFVITKDYANKLQQKVDTYLRITRTKKQIFIAMIASSGIKQNKYSKALISKVVTLNDLFKND